jgi:hypothetical protein
MPVTKVSFSHSVRIATLWIPRVTDAVNGNKKHQMKKPNGLTKFKMSQQFQTQQHHSDTMVPYTYQLT